MKVNHKLFALLLLFCIPVLASCEMLQVPQIDMPVSSAESAADIGTTASSPPERFTVETENRVVPKIYKKSKNWLRFSEPVFIIVDHQFS